MKQNTTYKQTELGLIPEDWEVKKLGELGKIINGLTYSPENIKENGTLVLRSSNVQNDKIVYDDNVFVEENISFNPTKKDDVLICVRNGSRGLIGKTALIDEQASNVAFGAFMAIYRSNSNNYIYNYFKSNYFFKEVHKNLGATINSINNNDLKKFKIPLPPLPEQKAIADCLSTWDDAIEKQNALINALTDRKKALMQQLLTAKKRLPWFSGEWKEVKLGSICENFQNGNAFSAKDYKKTGIPIVTMGNINLGGYFYFSESKSNFWIEDKSLERYEIKKGDLIIAMTDVTPEKNLIGLTSIIDIDRIFYLNQRVGHIILKPKLADTDFIFYLSQNSYWRNQCKAFATLGVQANLGTNDIKNINIKLPSFEEQTAIAEILATADRELQLQKEKLVQLQTQKKGLMQVLLTGKKRLIN